MTSQGLSKTMEKKIPKKKSIAIGLENKTKEKHAIDEVPGLRNSQEIILGCTIESPSIYSLSATLKKGAS